MSSLAATQADGYYVPPEYFESGQYKHKSRNQFVGSKGHNQFLQKGIARFELPYKSICTNCHESIARGTRFNAQKVKTEETYFTTPIWEFQLSCRKCQHPWKIRTNPKERGFDYIEGVTIQAGQEEMIDNVHLRTSNHDGIVTNLSGLESILQNERTKKTEMERLQGIQLLNTKTTLEDADWNASIRKTFRIDRKKNRIKQQEVSKIGWRDGMEWLNTSIEDQIEAKSTVYGKAQDTEQKHLGKVRTSSIFQDKTKKKSQKKRKRSTSVVPVAPDTVHSTQNKSSLLDVDHITGKEEESSISRPSNSGKPKKQTVQVSVHHRTGIVRTTNHVQSKIDSSQRLLVLPAPTTTTPRVVVASKKNHLLEDMLAGYGSSDSE